MGLDLCAGGVPGDERDGCPVSADGDELPEPPGSQRAAGDGYLADEPDAVGDPDPERAFAGGAGRIIAANGVRGRWRDHRRTGTAVAGVVDTAPRPGTGGEAHGGGGAGSSG